jgi:hypothetical protein
MNTKELLHTLAKQLEQLHCTSESKKVLRLMKYSTDGDLDILEGIRPGESEEGSVLEGATPQAITEIGQWTELLDEAQAPIPPQIFGKAIRFVVKGGVDLYNAATKLQELDPKEIKATIDLAQKVPGISSRGSYNFEKMEKIAKLLEEKFPGRMITETLIKNSQADWITSILGPSGKGVGYGLKLIPYIGVVFSALLAIKNLIYGIWEYTILIKEASKINLSWYETLDTAKLADKVKEYEKDPENLKIAVRTTKSAKVFMDEGISFVANGIDAVKDVIFLIIEAALTPTGWGAVVAGGADMASSGVIAIIEYGLEEDMAQRYDRVLEMIVEIAEDNIQRLTPAADTNVDYSEMSLEQLLSALS